jgi:hypothetical protein
LTRDLAVDDFEFRTEEFLPVRAAFHLGVFHMYGKVSIHCDVIYGLMNRTVFTLYLIVNIA